MPVSSDHEHTRMTQYFAVIHDDDHWGPFDSIHEPLALLNQSSRDRSHSDEQAYEFFTKGSAIRAVEDAGRVH
jgi:hypothetical protein